MNKTSCWFKPNVFSLLPIPLPLRTTDHAGGWQALLGLHWSFRSNLFCNSCPGCAFDHLDYTCWSCGMRHTIQVLCTYPVALPAWPNDWDCNMVRCAQALCDSVSTANGKNAEDRAPLGASSCSTMPGLQRDRAAPVCPATTSQPLFCLHRFVTTPSFGCQDRAPSPA